MASVCFLIDTECMCLPGTVFKKRCWLPFVILFVFWTGKVRVTTDVPAVCSFRALLTFQKDKEITKEEQSYVNTTLAFVVLPKKVQKEAKQVKDDNGLHFTCQKHSKLSSWLGTAAPFWTIYQTQEHLFRNTPASTSPAQHIHIHVVLCSQIDFSQKAVSVTAGCSCQWRQWSRMQRQCYTVLVFAWSLLAQGLLSCPETWGC